jgi:hypothetical protein
VYPGQLAPDTITTSLAMKQDKKETDKPTLRRDGIGGDDDVIE